MKPGRSDRRTVLKAALAAPLAGSARAGAAAPVAAAFTAERLMADLRLFAQAGNKQAGGPGDGLTADWLAQRLTEFGLEVERQRFDVPCFQTAHCALTFDSRETELVVQPPVVFTPPEGITGALVLAEVPGRLDGAIAIVRLPHWRWSSLLDNRVRSVLEDTARRGAAAVIVVTTGPSGEALRLNVPMAMNGTLPLALLAPRLAGKVLEAARNGLQARFVLTGERGMRPAENVVGRRDRPGRRWVVVSTPRSGWTDCVGERGPGIAIWLALAAWAPHALARHNLLFVATSGHEYENLGAGRFHDAFAPPPVDTDFWLHLGANVATRDYQEIPGGLLPLPSVDPNRFLMTSPGLVSAAREIFKGQPGIEAAYPSDNGAAGELTEIVRAGYPRHAGIFGAHRHHHAATDVLSTIVAEPLAITAISCRELVRRGSLAAL
ncbi:hypothetical protein B0I00_3010 [Novosphingobium kunmingense]|uniref:PA domain-containing protein n=1 Tax=Novosphingobium kunmingense TaxID=1211806 RepID=A0A2N0H3Q7_9SPHN|nr:hypothetical protein [Novosphingobium kunmingense]PKB13574.1 hypothetical protein B0I00_3010 [Novosphingobium kunmingense]